MPAAAPGAFWGRSPGTLDSFGIRGPFGHPRPEGQKFHVEHPLGPLRRDRAVVDTALHLPGRSPLARPPRRPVTEASPPLQARHHAGEQTPPAICIHDPSGPGQKGTGPSAAQGAAASLNVLPAVTWQPLHRGALWPRGAAKRYAAARAQRSVALAPWPALLSGRSPRILQNARAHQMRLLPAARRSTWNLRVSPRMRASHVAGRIVQAGADADT